MESFLGRYRNLTILVGVLFLQALGLAIQVKRSGDPENTRLIRVWVVDAITPFERILVWAQNGSSNLWHNYFYLRGVRAENRQLKQEIEQMRLEQVRLSEDAEQAHRLQKLLAFKEQVIGKPVAAQVIGTSGSDLSQSIYIDKGSNDGIKPDLAVITANGIVGKVLHVYPSTAQVLMINDQTSGVGAMLENSRLQGVLKGTPDGAVVLERVMSDEKVSPGETVLSSGGDQIFPKGLPVGTVTKVSLGHEMFLNIQVKPAADLNRLEEVLVVTEKQEQSAPVETAGRVRAADILAQRLPAVPDKPAANATTGSGTTTATMQPQSTPSTTKPQTATPTAAKPQASEHPASTTTATKPASSTSTATSTSAQPTPKKQIPPSNLTSSPAQTVNQPKPPALQPTPQPSAAEDDPH
jgi:rod shape-determining protein MreC